MPLYVNQDFKEREYYELEVAVGWFSHHDGRKVRAISIKTRDGGRIFLDMGEFEVLLDAGNRLIEAERDDLVKGDKPS